MMRCIPGVTVLEPADSVMLADLLHQTKDMYGVFYIRLSRKKAEKIYVDGSAFEIGKAAKLRDGKDVTIFATGICVSDAPVRRICWQNRALMPRYPICLPLNRSIVTRSWRQRSRQGRL